MYRVAPKIAQEIFVLFQNDYFHSDASKQKPKHHPGRAAADNATASPELLHRLTVLVHRGREDHSLLQRRWEINRTAEEAGELELACAPGSSISGRLHCSNLLLEALQLPRA